MSLTDWRCGLFCYYKTRIFPFRFATAAIAIGKTADDVGLIVAVGHDDFLHFFVAVDRTG